MQNDKLLNQAFDILSRIPYLKITMKILFLLTGGLMAFSFLFGNWQSNSHLLKTAIPCIIGNAIIAYLFRLWDKREKNKKKILFNIKNSSFNDR